VKKIISILLALGLVLSLTVMAAPVSADVDGPGVTPNPQVIFGGPPPCNCAGMTTCCNISFDITALMEEGVHEICIEFPADTYVPATFNDGDIGIYTSAFPGVFYPCFGSEVTVTDTTYGTQLCAILNTPWDVWPAADNPISIAITRAAGIKNPTTPGSYQLYVWTTRPQDSTPVLSDPYVIAPQFSTYDFQFDFSPTYPGLNPGFVPPFKACGQDMPTTSFCSTINGFLEPFDLNLITTVPGCSAPCSAADMWFVVEKCPVGEVITLVWDSGTTTYTLTNADEGDVQALPSVALTPLTTRTWSNEIHFSSPGDYEICFYLECPAVPCQAPGAEIVAEECLLASVYQWKNWFQIDLNPKWNLISLPLFPFNTDIEYIMSSLNWSDQFMSVWYYDRCEGADGTWHSYPGDLDTMEAGNAYWIRMKHPGDVGYNASFNTSNQAGLFVWGTHAPMPPADPMQSFDVCEGWNMVGFKPPWVGTPLAPTWEWDDLYLWNFFTIFGMPEYGTIYEWDSTVQDWNWYYPYGCQMQPGLGYWIPFERDGEIYPKA
jgi:hypothetical protein